MIDNEKIEELSNSYLIKKSSILKYLNKIISNPIVMDADEEDIYECLEKVVSIRSSQMEGGVISHVKVLTINEIIEIAINETFIPNTKEPMEYIVEDSVNSILEDEEVETVYPLLVKMKRG